MERPYPMTTPDLAELIKRREALSQRRERLIARYDAAQATLAEVEAEIRALGYDPDTFSADIDRLEAEHKANVVRFHEELSRLDSLLSPFEEK